MDNNAKNDYGIIFWIHLVLNLIFFFSWVFVSWWIILAGAIILRIQFLVIGTCILSKVEFGEKRGCIAYYLKKWGISVNEKKFDYFVINFLPIIVIVLAIVWQIILNIRPLLF